MAIIHLWLFTEPQGSSLYQLLFQGMVFDFETPKRHIFMIV